MARFDTIQTFTEPHLQRHRDTHARHVVFGTHRHPYLLDIMREVAGLAAASGEKPSLLDYGCGKGVFMGEMQRRNLFGFVRGYDPAVQRFRQRPGQLYDVVTCLDVLDQLEPEFVDAAIRDVAQFTAGIAVFSLISVQSANYAHLNPRSAETWRDTVGAIMEVTATTVRATPPEEVAQGGALERVIVLAKPR